MRRFDGVTAVVSGAASGIGLGIADRLIAEGATVIAVDLQASRLGDHISSRWEPIDMDVSVPGDWDDLAARLESRGVRVSVMVNSAGILAPGDLESLAYESFEKSMQTNAGGVLLGCRFAIRMMKASGMPGAIVNIASTTAIKPAAWVAAYAASKAAVVSLTRTTALHGATLPQIVRCNAVLPGVVLTPMVQGLIDASPDPSAALAGLRAQHPIGRLVEVDEVASAAVFLASNDASGITGASLVVDGGMTTG